MAADGNGSRLDGEGAQRSHLGLERVPFCREPMAAGRMVAEQHSTAQRGAGRDWTALRLAAGHEHHVEAGEEGVACIRLLKFSMPRAELLLGHEARRERLWFDEV